MFRYHLYALIIAIVIDLAVGEVSVAYNPINSLKSWLKYLDRALLGDDLILLENDKQKKMGVWFLILAVAPVAVISLFFNMLFHEISIYLWMLFEIVAVLLLVKGKRQYLSSNGVVSNYFDGGFSGANTAFAATFGKIENIQDEDDLISRTIEETSKKAIDAVIAPLLILFLFGPVGGAIASAVIMANDQVGKEDDRYFFFGEFTRRTYLVLMYVPIVFSSWIHLLASKTWLYDFNSKNAKYIYLRDGKKLRDVKRISAVYAGALSVALFDETIGDKDSKFSFLQVKLATNLMLVSYIICLLLLLALLIVF